VLVLLTREFMKYAVEMASGGMTYTPSFIEIGSGIQKLLRDTPPNTHTHARKHTHGVRVWTGFNWLQSVSNISTAIKLRTT
jgi:hypothetical protein